MPLFHRKAAPTLSYDPVSQRPAVRRSICTGERTLGFVDKATGKFHEYMLVRDQAGLEDFCRRAGVSPEELQTIY